MMGGAGRPVGAVRLLAPMSRWTGALPLLAACYSWEPAATPPPGAHLGHVRAHPCNGSPVELREAHVAADSLVGVLQEETAFEPRELRAIPVDSLCGLDRNSVNATTTVAVTLGIPIAAGIVWLISQSFTENASP